jgi:hypothetical protein
MRLSFVYDGRIGAAVVRRGSDGMHETYRVNMRITVQDLICNQVFENSELFERGLHHR